MTSSWPVVRVGSVGPIHFHFFVAGHLTRTISLSQRAEKVLPIAIVTALGRTTFALIVTHGWTTHYTFQISKAVIPQEVRIVFLDNVPTVLSGHAYCKRIETIDAMPQPEEVHQVHNVLLAQGG